MRSIIASETGPTLLPESKDPADKLLYRMDWTAFLTDVSDTVSTSVWVGGGLTATAPAIEAGNLSTTVWLAGGVAGTIYTVANTITTVGGRTIERSFVVSVAER